MKKHYLIGVDEAGRGPLAGPVAVGVVRLQHDFDWSLLPEVGDSKQLSETTRERVFQETQLLRKIGVLDFQVSMVGAQVIDAIGITKAIALAMRRSFIRLDLQPASSHIKLDGSLRAPSTFLNQETIIKGDSKEPSIGLASIMAKVTRDRYMVRESRKPEMARYDFAVHKGYGTKKHRALIEKHGLSPLHRVTYCKNLKY